MSTSGDGDPENGVSGEDEARALALRWPRELIQTGESAALAEHWVSSRRAASAAGRPALAGGPLTPALLQVLFEARRARRIVRGLEDTESALAAQAAGVRRGAGEGASGGVDRISRLLLVSNDGSDRFLIKVNSLYRIHGRVLEVYTCACDELALGESVFGAGHRARALLVDHKESVVHALRAIVGST